jgi:hypothetical protein
MQTHMHTCLSASTNTKDQRLFNTSAAANKPNNHQQKNTPQNRRRCTLQTKEKQKKNKTVANF